MVKLQDHESVRHDEESYSIGDKVYGAENASLSVGYIQEIEVLGVHVGFRAKVDSIIFDEPRWFDSRLLTHEPPITDDDLKWL